MRLARDAGLSVAPMADAADDWDCVLELSGYAPVSYSRDMIRYQLGYIHLQVAPCVDASVVIYHAGRAVAVWPLGFRMQGATWVVFSNEGDVLPPLFVSGLASSVLKSLVKGMLALLNRFGAEFGVSQWHGVESLAGRCDASLWHRQLMASGAQVHVLHEMYVDLSLDLAEIKSRLRKSYKSLLTSGLKLWSVNMLFREKSSVFNEFRELHKQVAGRVTRHIDTWNEQERAVQEGSAFLIFLRDEHGVMVGAGLFHISPHEGMYAVGAYDRTLFDKPLGHLVQMRAIETMKSMGLRWYKIGLRHYPGDSPAPSDKELNIAHFKEGFATHIFLRLHTRNSINSVAAGNR